MRTSSNLDARALHWANFLSSSETVAATADRPKVKMACDTAGGARLVVDWCAATGKAVGANDGIADTVGWGGKPEKLTTMVGSGKDGRRGPNVLATHAQVAQHLVVLNGAAKGWLVVAA